jgi:hypothetical protein
MSFNPLSLTPFLSLSVTTKTFVRPLLRWRSVTKSIETSPHIWSGIGKGFKKPCQRSLYSVFAPQASQFRTNLCTSRYIRGQKNCRARIAPVLSLLGCLYALESWVSWIIFVRSFSSSGTHSLPRNRSLLSELREHSLTDTLSLRSGGNVRFLSCRALTACLYDQSACRASS